MMSSQRGRRHRLPSVGLLALLLLLNGCQQAARRKQVRLCEQSLSETPVQFLVSTEGRRKLCECTVDRVAERFPDASARWVAYAAEMEQRVQSRGILGIIGDTAWMAGRGLEMAEFAGAQVEAVGACSVELLGRGG